MTCTPLFCVPPSSGCEGAEVLSTDTTGYDTPSNERSPAGDSQDGLGPLSSSSQDLQADITARPRTASELLLNR